MNEGFLPLQEQDTVFTSPFFFFPSSSSSFFFLFFCKVKKDKNKTNTHW